MCGLSQCIPLCAACRIASCAASSSCGMCPPRKTSVLGVWLRAESGRRGAEKCGREQGCVGACWPGLHAIRFCKHVVLFLYVVKKTRWMGRKSAGVRERGRRRERGRAVCRSVSCAACRIIQCAACRNALCTLHAYKILKAFLAQVSPSRSSIARRRAHASQFHRQHG